MARPTIYAPTGGRIGELVEAGRLARIEITGFGRVWAWWRIECDRCGQDFETRQPQRHYCSDECRSDAAREANRQRQRAYRQRKRDDRRA